jgi:hypothetical protein
MELSLVRYAFDRSSTALLASMSKEDADEEAAERDEGPSMNAEPPETGRYGSAASVTERRAVRDDIIRVLEPGDRGIWEEGGGGGE